jgi:hypothetical protein
MSAGTGFPAVSVAVKVKVTTALSGLNVTLVIVAVAVPVGGLCATATSARRPSAWQTAQLSIARAPVPGGPGGPGSPAGPVPPAGPVAPSFPEHPTKKSSRIRDGICRDMSDFFIHTPLGIKG